MRKIRSSLRRQYAIINALIDIERPTIKKIHAVTGIPITTLKRHLYSLASDFGMEIMYTKSNKDSADTGYYMIVEWGVIDKNAFTLKFGSIKD